MLVQCNDPSDLLRGPITHGKWCESIEKNTPKLKFGSNVDIDVLNPNPRIRIEILLRFYKIKDGGQDGRQTHSDTYFHF